MSLLDQYKSEYTQVDPKQPFAIIANRRNPLIKSKLYVSKLIRDGYRGGAEYTCQDYLERYIKESKKNFEARKKISVYPNNIQPIADELAGFIFTKEPEREIPESLNFLHDNASGGQPMDIFIKNLAVKSLMITTGVLVDSPAFDESLIQTRADREATGINPFVVLYPLENIRDFHIGDNGQLDWVLLDNTYTDNSDPLTEPICRRIYRLWNKFVYTDYEIKQNEKKEWVVIPGEERAHPIGAVPFKFVNWKDPNAELIPSTIFEDMAEIDKKIYNILSYLDEMLSAGTFSVLFWPGEVPADLVTQGLGSMSIAGYDSGTGHKPYFESAGLKDTDTYLRTITFLIKLLFKKIGQNQDEVQAANNQSGRALGKEFEKVESLLRFGSSALEECETWLYEIAAAWQGTDTTGLNINYIQEYQLDDIDRQLTRLQTLVLSPYESVQKEAWKQIVLKSMSGIPEERLDYLIESIESEEIYPVEINPDTVQNAESIAKSEVTYDEN